MSPSPVLIIGREASPTGQLLEQASIRFLRVETLPEALAQLEAARPALVVLHADVLEAEEGRVRETFAARAGKHRVPVVLLASRDAPVELIEAGWRAGVDDCIFLPLSPAQVAERLDAVAKEPAVLGANARRAPRAIVVSGDDAGLRTRLADLLEHSGYHVLDVGGEPPAVLPTEGRVHLLVVAGSSFRAGVAELRRVGTLLGPLASKDVPRAVIAPGVAAHAHESAPGLELLDRSAHIEALVGRIDRLVDRGPYDLRANARVPFFCPVEFREGGSSAPPPWRSGYTFNVTSGGVFVRTLVPPRAGVALEMRIRVTTTREEFPVTGVVAWANRYPGRRVYSYPVGMGVQFLGPPISRRLASLIELCREQVSAA